MNRSTPLIGITTGEVTDRDYPWSPTTYGQTFLYSDAVIGYGGLAVQIPLTENLDILRKTYERMDGLILSGGNDINPKMYGEKPWKELGKLSQKRDIAELNLLKWAREDSKPVLAICRGMQLLNISLGGTLHQDIPKALPQAQDHKISAAKQSHTHIAHQLKIKGDSILARIINSPVITANSLHHQAIKRLGNGLTATAWAEDGVIEAVELEDAVFTIGVQCHPEALLDIEPKWRLVFDEFIQCSSLVRKSPSSAA